MKKIVVDPSTLARLIGITDRAELCDETGQTIGYFRSAVDLSEYECLDTVSDEELHELEKQPGKYTTAEVLAHLEKLAQGENH